MVVNNWVVIMEGFVATTTVWARAFFMIWYVVCVIVVMNVCAGFLIDAYALLRPRVVEEIKQRRELTQVLEEVEQKPKSRGFAKLSQILFDLDLAHDLDNFKFLPHQQINDIVFDNLLQHHLGITVT